jgi:hypothetical protein
MKFILFFLILCSINVFSQENTLVKGKIINIETKEPIPYCSIVYLKKDKGVFSDSLGNFILKKEPLLDSIQITSLGYEKKLLSIQILEENNLVISLKPIYFKLNEVAITPDDNKTKKNKKKLGPIATKLNSPKGIGPGVLGRISAIYVAFFRALIAMCLIWTRSNVQSLLLFNKEFYYQFLILALIR